MPSCVVNSCKNYMSKLKKSHGITYHAFPRNKNRKDDWILIIRNCRGENDWNPSPSSTVCSAHFDDADFIITAKGLRCLVPYAIPKKLLSNPPETQTQSTSSPILKISPNVKRVANDPQPSSSPSTISSLFQEPVPTDNFALTEYCRLCATSNCDSQLINVQSDNALKKLVVNMTKRLNTNIDFSQEHLPTTICSECVKSLYTAYDFVVGIDLAQMTLNKISMQKYKYQMPDFFRLGNNMDLLSTSLQQINNGSEVHNFEQPTLHALSTTILRTQVSPKIEKAESNFEQSLPFILNITTPVPTISSNIKEEVNHFDEPDVSSTITPLQQLSPNTEAAMNNFKQPPLLESSFLLDSPRKRRLKDILNKKKQIIDQQKKNIKRLNQKVRRLQNRNESLKNIMKTLKDRNYIGTDLFNTLNDNINAADLFNHSNRKKLKKNIR